MVRRTLMVALGDFLFESFDEFFFFGGGGKFGDHVGVEVTFPRKS